jgi:hypothetical protein
MLRARCHLSVVVLFAVTADFAAASGWDRPVPARSIVWSSPGPVVICWPYYPPIAHAPPTVMPLAVPTPVPSPIVAPLAVPTPAPPSKHTAEAPLGTRVEMPLADKDVKLPAIAKPGPTVFELRPNVSPPAKERCRVGFWNLTGRDVTLVVDGKSQLLPRDRAVTLELPREFSWQIDQQPARSERVANEKASHEIVIR